jgi:hypothetical protein
LPRPSSVRPEATKRSLPRPPKAMPAGSTRPWPLAKISKNLPVSVVTKHLIAAAADVQVAVGTGGDALGFDDAATAGELTLKRADLAVVGQDALRVGAADVQRNVVVLAGGRDGPRGPGLYLHDETPGSDDDQQRGETVLLSTEAVAQTPGEPVRSFRTWPPKTPVSSVTRMSSVARSSRMAPLACLSASGPRLFRNGCVRQPPSAAVVSSAADADDCNHARKRKCGDERQDTRDSSPVSARLAHVAHMLRVSTVGRAARAGPVGPRCFR